MTKTSSPATSGARGTRITKTEHLRRHLLELIETSLSPHDKLPTERELAEQFSMSRLTVRQVLSRLEMEGRVYREQGSGTFVSEPRIAKSLELTSFSEDMRSRGLQPGSREVVVTRRAAGADVAFALGISPREEVLHFHRIRTADGTPMCIEDSYIPAALAPGLQDAEVDGSLYEMLETRFHLRLDRAEQTIRVTVLDPDDAHQLESIEYGPAFDVHRVGLDVRGRKIEYARSIYRGDRYSYNLTIFRA
ncbi:MAG TPA: GntR family transcriptional regulator [Gryllotalpicola sp.]